MLRVFSFSDTKKFDRLAEDKGFSVETLMEIAGKGVYETVKGRFKRIKGLKVVVVCGKGNNGGDGLVCARYLSLEGANVRVYIPTYELKGLPKIQLERLKGLCELKLYSDDMLLDILRADIVIDAIFGVGFSGKPKEEYRRAIEYINEGEFIISIDVPSGVSSEGEVEDVCVNANITVCIGAVKRAVLLYPGKSYAGDIEIVSLGVPLSDDFGDFLVEEDDIKKLLPTRMGNEHKGKFGRVLIYAGSKKYPGALNLTLLGSLRSGVGLVYALKQKDLSVMFPEVIPIEHDYDIDEIEVSPNSLAIGPGISTDDKSLKLAETLLDIFSDIPTVLDADGLYMLKRRKDLLKRENLVLTPHPGEFAKIFGGSAYDIDRNRIEIAKRFSLENSCVLLLKGRPTVIGYKGKVYVNPTGNPSLAKGGSGDILTGLIAGLMAQNMDPLKAAICGAYIHGKAGDKFTDGRSIRIYEIGERIKDIMEDLLRCKS